MRVCIHEKKWNYITCIDLKHKFWFHFLKVTHWRQSGNVAKITGKRRKLWYLCFSSCWQFNILVCYSETYLNINVFLARGVPETDLYVAIGVLIALLALVVGVVIYQRRRIIDPLNKRSQIENTQTRSPTQPRDYVDITQSEYITLDTVNQESHYNVIWFYWKCLSSCEPCVTL